MDIAASANRARISAELLMEVVDAINALRDHGRGDVTGRMMTIIQIVRAKESSEEDRRDLALAIEFRLHALAALLKSGVAGLRGSTLPALLEPDALLVSRKIFEVAATEPLAMVGEDLRFDPESFTARLLDISKPHGTA